MAVMYLGTLVEIGPADEVFFEPKHPYTEILVGSNPEPDPDQRTAARIDDDPGRDPLTGQRAAPAAASPTGAPRRCLDVARRRPFSFR